MHCRSSTTLIILQHLLILSSPVSRWLLQLVLFYSVCPSVPVSSTWPLLPEPPPELSCSEIINGDSCLCFPATWTPSCTSLHACLHLFSCPIPVDLWILNYFCLDLLLLPVSFSSLYHEVTELLLFSWLSAFGSFPLFPSLAHTLWQFDQRCQYYIHTF